MRKNNTNYKYGVLFLLNISLQNMYHVPVDNTNQDPDEK